MWTLVIGNLVHDGDFFPASSWQKFLIAMENVCFVWINVCVKCWDHSVNNAFGQLSVEGFLVNQKCNLMIDQKMEIDFWSTHIEIYYTSSKRTCLNIWSIVIFAWSTHHLDNWVSIKYSVRTLLKWEITLQLLSCSI